jgi:hypothetical protein
MSIPKTNTAVLGRGNSAMSLESQISPRNSSLNSFRGAQIAPLSPSASDNKLVDVAVETSNPAKALEQFKTKKLTRRRAATGSDNEAAKNSPSG